MIGGGRYACIETEGACKNAEVAFIVEEDYHGQGMASMLLQRLAVIARTRGLRQFEAEVLVQNRAMLTVFSNSGLPVHEKFEGDTIHVTMPLTEEGG